MNGTTVETVASSWIDALGGVSLCCILRMPPAFCAQPASAVAITNATTPANAKHPFRIFMLFPPSSEPRGRGIGATVGVVWSIPPASIVNSPEQPCKVGFAMFAAQAGTAANEAVYL